MESKGVIFDGFYKGKKFFVVHNDITNEPVNAIVNPANQNLNLGTGVSGSILKNGGQSIQDECNKIIADNGIVEVGNSVHTNAGSLNCRYIIHTVGPVYKNGKNAESTLLKKAVSSALKLANFLNIESIAIPAISCGNFLFPIVRSARIIVNSLKSFIDEIFNQNIQFSVKEIRLTSIDINVAEILKDELCYMLNNPLLQLDFEYDQKKDKKDKNDKKFGYNDPNQKRIIPNEEKKACCLIF